MHMHPHKTYRTASRCFPRSVPPEWACRAVRGSCRTRHRIIPYKARRATRSLTKGAVHTCCTPNFHSHASAPRARKTPARCQVRNKQQHARHDEQDPIRRASSQDGAPNMAAGAKQTSTRKAQRPSSKGRVCLCVREDRRLLQCAVHVARCRRDDCHSGRARRPATAVATAEAADALPDRDRPAAASLPGKRLLSRPTASRRPSCAHAHVPKRRPPQPHPHRCAAAGDVPGPPTRKQAGERGARAPPSAATAILAKGGRGETLHHQ